MADKKNSKTITPSKKTAVKKLRLGIIYGGKSGEHDVSRCSAASVAGVASRTYDVICIGITKDGRWFVQDGVHCENHPAFGQVLSLKHKGKWHIDVSAADDALHLVDAKTGKEVIADVVFPLVHGTYGEDGTLQGLLDMVGVPYIGPGVLGSAVGMDKDIAKRIIMHYDSSVIVPFKAITREAAGNPEGMKRTIKAIAAMLPVFIKPANAGSSVGVTKVTRMEQIEKALKAAFTYDSKIIAEKAVDCHEYEVSVMGNENPAASAVGQVIPAHEYYSYEAKYVDKDGAQLIIPAPIPEKLASQLKETACSIYTMLECRGMARVDFFVDKHDNTIYFNEVNTLPGFTSISMYPKLWEHSGVSYYKLIDMLVNFAVKQHRSRKKTVKAFLAAKK